MLSGGTPPEIEATAIIVGRLAKALSGLVGNAKEFKDGIAAAPPGTDPGIAAALASIRQKMD